MFSPFKLLVYAVFSVALISVILLLFGFFPQEVDSVDELKLKLSKAESLQGQFFETREMLLQSGESIPAKTFNARKRLVDFRCNIPGLCCPEGEKCEKAVEWEREYVKFNETRRLKAYARCEEKAGVILCSVFFGLPPAQAELENVSIPSELDLAEGTSATVKFDVLNTGEMDGIEWGVSVKLYRKYWDAGEEKKAVWGDEWEYIKVIEPREKKHFQYNFELEEEDSYSIKARVEGIESGFAEVERDLEVINSGESLCEATEEEETAYLSSVREGMCFRKYFCEGCSFGFECSSAWEKKLPEKEFEASSKDYAFEYFSNEGKDCGGTIQPPDELPEEPPEHPPEEPPVEPPVWPPVEEPEENEYLAWPTTLYRVSSCFGMRELDGKDDFHDGIDIAVAVGSSVFAAEEGTVKETCFNEREDCRGYGNYIILKHNENLFTRYSHLSEIHVYEEKEVGKREKIGESGNTGKSGGSHLDFKVYESPNLLKDQGSNPFCHFSEETYQKAEFTPSAYSCDPNKFDDPRFECSQPA